MTQITPSRMENGWIRSPSQHLARLFQDYGRWRPLGCRQMGNSTHPEAGWQPRLHVQVRYLGKKILSGVVLSRARFAARGYPTVPFTCISFH